MGTDEQIKKLKEEKATTKYIKDFYSEYYNRDTTPINFPIPVIKTTLPFLFLQNVKDNERTPLITLSNKSESKLFAATCEQLILRPLLDYFWEFYCSVELKLKLISSVKYNLVMQLKTVNEKNAKEMLTSYLYCYLFGTCRNAVNHNGVITDDVPGEIISLGLVQYTVQKSEKKTKKEEPESRIYLSYSVAELQSVVKQFMAQPSYKQLLDPVITARKALDDFLNQQEQQMYQHVGDDIDVETPEVDVQEDELRNRIEDAIDGERKTPEEWEKWSRTQIGPRVIIQPEAVKLPGRPETSQTLMTMFMGDVLGGVVKNYKYFSKKQRQELGIDNLVSFSKPEEEVDPEKVPELTEDQKAEIKEKTGAKPRTLMELYNIVLYNVALVNIENINVAKVSLLSKRIGNYLSNMEDLMSDILSGVELDNPIYSFSNLIISLFVTMSKERIDGAFSNKDRLKLFINATIEQYNKDSAFRRQVRMIITEYGGLEDNIVGILQKKPQVKETTIFGRLLEDISKSEEEKYIDFLKSLLPRGALRSGPLAIAPQKAGSKTQKNLPKKKNRSFSRRL
jgi:hypothetical protein